MNRVIASLLLLWPECKVGFFYDLIDSVAESICTHCSGSQIDPGFQNKNSGCRLTGRGTTVLIVSGLNSESVKFIEKSNI